MLRLKLADRLNYVKSLAAPFRILLFLITLLILWLPIAAPLYLTLGEPVGIHLTILLYCGFLALIWFWGRQVSGYAQPYRHHGLIFSRQNGYELLLGWGLGSITLVFFYGLQWQLGWLAVQTTNLGIPSSLLPILGIYFVDWQGAIAPGALTAIGVGIAEEILFRGWMLSELEQDYSPRRSLIIASLIFAILHFIKPLHVILATWSQFAGLVVLAIVLILARRRCHGRLGMSIGLHGGLVWGYYIVNTTHWFKPTGIVPEWITGIGGNPVAGMVGIIFLTAIAIGLRPSKLSHEVR
ncbi:MAG: type II CAAX endopeptidase family protein [Pseudanabaenaceae cyanobacterium bins.39]|nr:type II CAAX endopeptidase family protein [Pseudanabaenaceae cyanobacterium bins.39]